MLVTYFIFRLSSIFLVIQMLETALSLFSSSSGKNDRLFGFYNGKDVKLVD